MDKTDFSKIRKLVTEAGFSAALVDYVGGLVGKVERGEKLTNEEIEGVYERMSEEVAAVKAGADGSSYTAAAFSGAVAQIKTMMELTKKEMDDTDHSMNEDLDGLEAEALKNSVSRSSPV